MARIAAFLFVVLCAMGAVAQPPSGPPQKAEDYALAQILQDRIADLNDNCRQTLDPSAAAGWDQPCRTITAKWLVNLLTNPKLADWLPQHGVRLKGAHITGPLDLANTDIKPAFWLIDSRIEGQVTLYDSHWHRLLTLRGSWIAGGLSAERLRADSNVQIDRKARIEHGVDLGGAVIGGYLAFGGASVGEGVDLGSVDVAGDLFLGNAKFEGEVNAVGARIGGNLEMENSVFGAAVDLNRASVGSSLLMYDATWLGGTASGDLSAVALRVGHNVFVRGARFTGAVNLSGAKIGEILDLTAVTASAIDLADAQAKYLLLNGLRWGCASSVRPPGTGPVAGSKPAVGKWPLGDGGRRGTNCAGSGDGAAPRLSLHNARFGEFQDDVDAWPPNLDLVGFRYERFGGPGGDGRLAMHDRPLREWKDWLGRDPIFSAQPYAELAAALTTAKDRDAGDEIQLAGRERERQDAYGDVFRWAWLGFLASTAGYGIAHYLWRVLPWLAGFTAIGTLCLAFSPNARRHGPVWMLGASLHRLLPVVSLYQKFDDFFANPPATAPHPRNLAPWQVVYFAIHAIVGWALGLILLAAMSGITQKG
jgi:hypothetical protein